MIPSEPLYGETVMRHGSRVRITAHVASDYGVIPIDTRGTVLFAMSENSYRCAFEIEIGYQGELKEVTVTVLAGTVLEIPHAA